MTNLKNLGRDVAPLILVLSAFLVCCALGGVCAGDQLLNVEGTSLLGVSVQQAHEELNKAMNRNSVSLY